MNKSIAGLLVASAAVAAGSFMGYQLATRPELRYRLARNAKDAFQTSRQKIATMSEDVAVRTAQMTKNPKINQEWVAHQWENVGY